ncbi:LLM class flavin-dependent oxidoreductase [Terrarubrum flagellatum]|uniref:LLM class flavin-dependent oxidoreductase n=1 Tax=Terrirubrum flagellatum TaxID=2895980 RepID=UPI00314548F0
MEIGVYTFGDVKPGGDITPRRRLRDLIEEITLADQVGLDVFGVGEHHRPDYSVSAPPIVMAAAAERTKNIKLTSAVTVLSSEDPVRVYQQFATLDLLSDGRAEIMAGRGSFIESFPLFGHDLDDYDALFAENLDLLLRIRERERVTWEPGHHRAAIDNRGVYPRAERELPVWIAVGGTPQSVARAGALGLPLAIAIIGGEPARFRPLVDLYHEAGRRAGVDPAKLKVGVNGHGLVGDTSQQAADAFYPSYAETMAKIGRERGWGPMSRAQFDASTGLRGHLAVGGPQEVIDKIMHQREALGHDRHLMQMSVGATPHKAIMRSIELLGTKVAPVIREETAAKPALIAAD